MELTVVARIDFRGIPASTLFTISAKNLVASLSQTYHSTSIDFTKFHSKCQEDTTDVVKFIQITLSSLCDQRYGVLLESSISSVLFAYI